MIKVGIFSPPPLQVVYLLNFSCTSESFLQLCLWEVHSRCLLILIQASVSGQVVSGSKMFLESLCVRIQPARSATISTAFIVVVVVVLEIGLFAFFLSVRLKDWYQSSIRSLLSQPSSAPKRWTSMKQKVDLFVNSYRQSKTKVWNFRGSNVYTSFTK